MIAMALAILALQDGGGASAPRFEFRQFNTTLSQEVAVSTGLVFVMGRNPACNETPMNGRDVSVCVLPSAVTEPGVAGRPIRAGQAGFDAEGLVLFRLLVGGEDATVIESAMTAKFGEPCRHEMGEWRNRMGAVLENPTTAWCLADGELSIAGRSAQDPNYAELKFLAGRLTEAPIPVVDF